jgi:hypothetical protein
MNTPETFTLLDCSQCDSGHYTRDGWGIVRCTNPTCGHKVYAGDFDLDPGERLAWDASGRLGYTTDDDTTEED